MNVNANVESNLLDLDDYSLKMIFCYLDNLKDQVNISRSCNRFRSIVYSYIWSLEPKYRNFDLNLWQSWLPEDDDFHYFFHQIKDRIETVIVCDIPLASLFAKLQHFGVVEMPHVKTLNNEFILTADNELIEERQLTIMFPNLRTLFYPIELTGEFLERLINLEELYLYGDKSFEIDDHYFANICKKLSKLRVLDIRNFEISNLDIQPISACVQLEVLRVNFGPLKRALPTVLRLPKLKSLRVLYDWTADTTGIQNVDQFNFKTGEVKEFFEIIEYKAEHLVGIAVAESHMLLKSNWHDDLPIWRYNKLHTLAISNCTERPDMLDRYVCMKNLTTLSLRQWSQLNNDIVLKLVSVCTMIVHLDVSFNDKDRLTASLLHDLLKNLKLQRRKLIFYYLLSGLDDEIEKVNSTYWNAQYAHIKFTSEMPTNLENGPNCIERGFQLDFE